MSIATEVRRGYAKHAGRVKLRDLQLEFQFQKPEQEEDVWTEEEAKTYSNWLKQAYLARWKTQRPEGVE